MPEVGCWHEVNYCLYHYKLFVSDAISTMINHMSNVWLKKDGAHTISKEPTFC